MADVHNDGSYSRELGVASYRKRRRQSRILRCVVALVLIAIIGGASYMFGKQFIDPDSLPVDLPGVEKSAPTVSETTEVSLPTVQPVTLNVLAAGDVIPSGAVAESGRKESGAYDFSHLFSHIAKEISLFDLRMVNQEAVMAGERLGFGADYPLNAPQDLGRAENAAGFNVVLHANDHALDAQPEGIHNELTWWHDNFPQIAVVGIADPQPKNNPTLSDYVNNVYIFEKDGFKVAVLNHTWIENEQNKGVVSVLSEKKVAADVAKAREQGAEMIIACPHWGDENNAELNSDQVNFARVYAELGVDLVLGTHPRVLQGVDVLQATNGHKMVCFYSLGCLISPYDDNNLLGGLAEVELSRDDHGACQVSSAKLKPVITHRGNGEEYCTYLLSAYTEDIAMTGWDAWIPIDEWNHKCEEALGSSYDSNTCELKVDVTKATPVSKLSDKSEDEAEATEEEEYGYI